MQKVMNIGIIGAGKVASNLAVSMKNAGFHIDWIWSRTQASAERLAGLVQSAPLSSREGPLPGTGLIIISVPDHAIAEIVLKLIPAYTETPVVHTSGSLGLEVLSAHCPNAGVFYPLQTFSENRMVALKDVPFCIETGQPELMDLMESWVLQLGGKPVRTLPGQRMCLHIAAVFACNFSNYLYTLAEEVLTDSGLSFDLLHPLLEETMLKATDHSPSLVQTGPAFRGDTAIISAHLEWLKKKPALQAAYDLLSRQILEKYNTDGKL